MTVISPVGARVLPKIWLIAVAVGAAASPLCAHAADPKGAAEAAAASWLALVDAGQYARSWSEGATYLRQTVAQSEWALSVARARAVLGPLKSRQLQSAYATSYLPDSPNGHYVVIHYSSRFARRAHATETITTIEESAGQWRVVGYYVN